MNRIVNMMGKINWQATGVLVLCATTAIALPAQTFNIVHNFNGVDGELPHAGLLEAADGNLYGITAGEGANRHGGTVFKITNGTLTTLYNFCSKPACADGKDPHAALIQSTGGDLYGTTYMGGANKLGTVFKITTEGKLTTLYSFCSQGGCADGSYPEGPMVQATDGSFYGTTSGGGAHGSSGTVFRITPTGALTTLYSFCSQSGCADGVSPESGLIRATDGDFYGTTVTGGANCREGCGTVFKVTAGGALTTLYSFCSQSGCTDGATPVAGLVQASNGNFYGTTQNGGGKALGTIFEITAGGTLTTLYRFCTQTGCPDGSYPNGGLLVAADGTLYGTTGFGGACALPSGCGTLFKMTQSGILTTLYNFCSQNECTDGETPEAPLVRGANGDLYGTTNFGGAVIGGCSSGNGCGTIFSLCGF